MYRENPKPMRVEQSKRLLRAARELDRMLFHLRTRPLPVFPDHQQRRPELRLCKTLEALVAEGRELASAQTYSEVGEVELHAQVATYYATVYAAKREFYDHLRGLREQFKL